MNPSRVVRILLLPMALLAMSATAIAGSIVETQQSTSYEVPAGWSVERWTEKTGEAVLKNASTGNILIVERYGLSGTPSNYPNREAVGDRTLTWEYVDIFGEGYFTLSGEVKFKDALIRMWFATTLVAGVDKEASLAAMRVIAKSVKILGARKCWPAGECPPGTVTEVK